MSFLNRTDAGRQLAIALAHRTSHESIIIGVTRGGVPVAAEVAREIGATLEICVVRKLMVDGHVVGSVAEAGGLYIDWARVEAFGIAAEAIEAAVQRETTQVVRLGALYRDRPALLVGGYDVLLVDDGLTNPATLQAAIHSLRRRDARTIEVAVPIADACALDTLRPMCDGIIALEIENPLSSIGAHYSDASAVSEAEVVDLLADSRRGTSGLRRAVSRRAY